MHCLFWMDVTLFIIHVKYYYTGDLFVRTFGPQLLVQL